MRTLSVVFLAGLALALSGCGAKPEDDKKDQKSSYDTGLKELKKEDVVVGKPTRFFPDSKPLGEGDRAYVRYKGTFLSDGVEFDSNLGPEDNAISFVVGGREVIAGWEEGLQGMFPGGKRKISIPWAKGYGDKGDQRKIPGKADLFFEVELVDMVKADSQNGYGIFDKKKGAGAEAKAGSTVTVEYELRIPGEDTVFDSSQMQNLKPSFKIGSETAWPGVEDGIIGMKVGGEREIWLPPMLSPVTRELEGFPENTITIFTVRLLAVK
jgi:FKBP-type peptidyl-prolyl cis-trans isomerase